MVAILLSSGTDPPFDLSYTVRWKRTVAPFGVAFTPPPTSTMLRILTRMALLEPYSLYGLFGLPGECRARYGVATFGAAIVMTVGQSRMFVSARSYDSRARMKCAMLLRFTASLLVTWRF